MILEAAKRACRMADACWNPRTTQVTVRGELLRLVKPLWWSEAEQSWFDQEIEPYFAALSKQTYKGIIDAGAASGGFSVAAAKLIPSAHVFAFEPSPRQRALLQRNVRFNNLDSLVDVEGFGLWTKRDRLAFRTHGAISSVKSVSALPDYLPFEETVEVISLDEWYHLHARPRVDLIKADVEGAELEALAGAAEVLSTEQPELLLQAYHLRNGLRTFERCADLLVKYGYSCREVEGYSGFLHAVPQVRA